MIRRSQGFTLIELMVAMAIFAVASLLVYRALEQFLLTRDHLQQQSQRLADLQLAHVIMGNDFGQVVERPIRDEYLQVKGSFLAIPAVRGQFLEFSREGQPNPAGLVRSTLLRVAYRLEEGSLNRQVWEQMDRASGTVSHEGALITGVTSLKLRYLNQQGQWFDSWPPPIQNVFNLSTKNGPQQFLPTAVELKLELKDMGTIRWVFAADD